MEEGKALCGLLIPGWELRRGSAVRELTQGCEGCMNPNMACGILSHERGQPFEQSIYHLVPTAYRLYFTVRGGLRSF